MWYIGLGISAIGLVVFLSMWRLGEDEETVEGDDQISREKGELPYDYGEERER